jgi:hypothetical protein
VLFLCLGYIALVNAFNAPVRGGRAGAMLALVGSVNVVIIHHSVEWWSTLHQPASVFRMGGLTIDASMLWPLLIMALGFTLAFVALLLVRMRTALIAAKIRALRLAEVEQWKAVEPKKRSHGADGLSSCFEETRMTIACLGWGSLIWDRRDLPLRSRWHCNGPLLPVEFARESRDTRITLVLVRGSPSLPVLWAEMDVTNVAMACIALADREDVKPKNIGRDIGAWPAPLGSNFRFADVIERWAVANRFDAVVWTALPPKFGQQSDVVPSVQQVIDHLGQLKGEIRENAERYIRRAPRQIMTAYRDQISKRLGWEYDGSHTDEQIEKV